MNTITILYRYFNVVINFDIMLGEERKLDKPVLQSFFLAKKNKLVFHVTHVCKIGEFIVFIKLMFYLLTRIVSIFVYLYVFANNPYFNSVGVSM